MTKGSESLLQEVKRIKFWTVREKLQRLKTEVVFVKNNFTVLVLGMKRV